MNDWQPSTFLDKCTNCGHFLNPQGKCFYASASEADYAHACCDELCVDLWLEKQKNLTNR